MAIDERERLRRWRLILGEDANSLGASLDSTDAGIDRTLAALYGGGDEVERSAGLNASSPNVNRWLGDIRTYFPASVVQVMQRDALERLNLTRMLLEPELLAAVEPDVSLVATLLALNKVIPEGTRETARAVVRRVTDDLERRLARQTVQAIRGSLHRATRTRRPRANEIDWDRTIRANLRHYLPERRTIIAERLVGYGHKRASLRDIVLCVDQSGSMAPSVVYAGVFGAMLASIRAISTRMIVFDTSVVDLTDDVHDPVDLLFGTQLGGGTDIIRALAYCQSLISRPAQTILVLLSDLYEGGNAPEMLRRAASLVASGVQVVCLLALSDRGAPAFNAQHAASFAAIGIPVFACTPDLFPDLMAAAINRHDLNLWASQQDLAVAGGGSG